MIENTIHEKIKKDLNTYEKVIYMELYSKKDDEDKIYETIVSMATELKLNKNTISKYLKSLEKKNYIEIEKRKVLAGNKNIYKLKVF